MIYFIKCNSFVKIGYSKKDPQSRLNAMQTGNPYKLVLIKTIDGPVARERELHKKFKKYRVRGEWFKYTKELSNFINSVEYEYIPKPKPQKKRKAWQPTLSPISNIVLGKTEPATYIQQRALANIANTHYDISFDELVLSMGCDPDSLTYGEAVMCIKYSFPYH